MSRKIFKVDSQILDAFSQCERLGELLFVRNLQPKDASYPMQRGSLIHDIQELFYNLYRENRNRDKSSMEALRYGRSQINKYDAIDIPRGMEILDNMREYYNFYMNERWLPVEVEKIHKKVIFEDSEIVVFYVGKIDLRVIGEPDTKGSIPVDHKGYDRWYEPTGRENQFVGYTVITDSDYFVLNRIGFQKSYPPEKKFRRVKMYMSEAKKQEWIHNTARICKDIVHCLETGTFPMRNTQCGMYGGCKMLPICEKDWRAREEIIKLQYRVTPDWDPEKIKDVE